MPTLKDRIVAFRPDPKTLSVRFRKWQVEALLNQSADLIDRCLDELGQYSALDDAATRFNIALNEDLREISLDENRTGYFERDKVAADKRHAFLDNVNGPLGQSMVEAKKLYDYQAGQGQGYNGWTLAGQHLSEKQVELVNHDADLSFAVLFGEWALIDRDYFQAKLQSRKTTAQANADASAPGMALAYEWQRDIVADRVADSYEDALSRAVIADSGLRLIYGYEDVGGPMPPDDAPPQEAISWLARWIRRAIAWLVAYQQLDQAFSRIASLKWLLGKSEWDMLRDSKNSFSSRVGFGASLFEEHENVRIRGIAASILGKAGVIPWMLKVNVPRTGLYVRGETSVPVDQTEIPACILGRVENRTSHRPIEICGQISLMNASPVGDSGATGATSELGMWSILITKPNATDEEFSDIDDILLELDLVGVPRGGQ